MIQRTMLNGKMKHINDFISRNGECQERYRKEYFMKKGQLVMILAGETESGYCFPKWRVKTLFRIISQIRCCPLQNFSPKYRLDIRSYY